MKLLNLGCLAALTTASTAGSSLAAATVNNLELGIQNMKTSGDFAAFSVSEAEQGNGDLNGDGDALDTVLHAYESTTDSLVNLGLASSTYWLTGNLIAVRVSEIQHGGSDFNGDGDAIDDVLHVYDFADGTLTNLGVATESSLASSSHLLAFSVDESNQGNTDLNGDGDTLDTVLHVYHIISGTLENLARVGQNPSIDGSTVAFSVIEAQQGNADLNGDGDVDDRVVHVFEATTATMTNTGMTSGTGLQLVQGNHVAFPVFEGGQDMTDLNGDGDVEDGVMHVYEVSTGIVTNTGMASPGFSFEINLLVFPVSEPSQGSTDFNADGDAGDSVLFVYDVSSGTLTNVGRASSGIGIAIHGSRVAFAVPEGNQGSTDFNGDGDAQDLVFHIYDATSDSLTNVGVDVVSFTFDGSMAALRVRESNQDNTDLNGDGDADDFVLHVHLLATDTTTNTGLASSLQTSSGVDLPLALDRVAIGILESSQGNADLNGDGDADDIVLHVFDATTGTVTNSGLAPSPRPFGIGFSFENDRIILAVIESDQGTSDLNADGDALDRVVHVITVSANAAPIADAGPDQTVECTGSLTFVSLDGSGSSDPDGDALSSEWSLPAGASIDDPFSPTPLGAFPLGPTLVTLTVTDGNGGVSTDDVLITVIDTTAPAVICTTDLISLWPADHSMRMVEVCVAVTDQCSDVTLTCQVESSEPDDGSGDGAFTGDINGSDGYAAPVLVTLTYDPDSDCFTGVVELRAERDGTENGRSYSISCEVSDFSGNTASAGCVVVVPHDRRKNQH